MDTLYLEIIPEAAADETQEALLVTHYIHTILLMMIRNGDDGC